MTPKEKAKQLIDRMLEIVSNHDCYGSEYLVAKDAALATVDEVLDENFIDECDFSYKRSFFWEEVKQEIIQL